MLDSAGILRTDEEGAEQYESQEYLPQVGLVLFGTGRQGNVHLENILASPRVVRITF